LHARGHRLLFADADGATDVNELQKMEVLLCGEGGQPGICKRGLGIVIGSRAGLKKEALVDTRCNNDNMLALVFPRSASPSCVACGVVCVRFFDAG